MAEQCINPDPYRRKYGFAQPMVDALKRVFGRYPTTEEARNVVRNLGIDDQRALDIQYKTAGGKNRYFFRKNIKDIEEWDYTKGEVPSQTVVKKTMPDGSVKFYMSGRKTILAPTRWVEADGRIRPNPDWDAVGENVTFKNGVPQQFVRLSDGTYRLAEEGEKGVFLNIQNPHRGRELSNAEILDMEIDAYDLGGGRYRLIDELTQAIEPDKAGLRQSRDAFFKEIEETKPTTEELIETAAESGIGRPLGYAFGGAMIGAYMQEDDGTAGAWLGGGLGLMLGSRRVRNKVKGVYTGRKSKDLDQHAVDIDRLETQQKQNRELVEEGYAGHLDDETEKSFFRRQVLDPMREAARAGQSTAHYLFGKYFTSGLSAFVNMTGSKTARKLLSVMEGAQSSANQVYVRYTRSLEREFGERGWREARAEQVNLIRQLEGDEAISEEDAAQLFGESMMRIITYRVEIKDGRFRYDPSLRGADTIYSNQHILARDRAILESETGQRMRRALQDTFNGIADEQVKALDQQIARLIGSLEGSVRRDVESMLGQPLSFKQWYETLSDLSLKKRVKEHFSGYEQINEIIEYHDRKVMIESLRGAYFPQIFSSKKAMKDYEDFIRRRGLMSASVAERNKAYWEARGKNMAELHHNADRLLSITSDGMDVDTRYFGSYSDAVKTLRRLADRIPDDDIRNEVLLDLQSNSPGRINKYIGEEMVEGRRKFYVRNPESFSRNGINIMETLNYEEILKANNVFMAGVHLRKSNHLDRARKTVLPTNMIETDIDKVMRHYANDVGPRLHFLKENLATVSDINRTLNQIRAEVGDRLTYRFRETNLNRIKTWWNISQMGQDYIVVGRSADEQALQLEKMSAIHKVLQGVANFATGGFMYFTSIYAVGQPLLMAPFFANWRQIRGAYREIWERPETLTRIVDEFEKMNIFDKTRKGTYNPAAEQGIHADRVPGVEMSMVNRFYNFSQKLVNFGSEFSFTKPILEKMGIDLERGGLMRLIAGNLMDVSSAEAGVTTLAILRHMEDLVAAGKQILDTGQGQVNIGGKSYRRGDVWRQLEDFGVSNVERFIESKDRFNAYVKHLTGDNVNFREAFNSEHEYLQFYDQITRIINTIVDQYHGRSQLSRPESWVDNPYGRALSRFSSHPQNFGVRVVRQRMYQPIKDWTDTYKMGDVDNHSLFKIAYHMANNNEGQLKKIFGVKGAFDNVGVEKDLAERFYNAGQKSDFFVDNLSEAEQARWFAAMENQSFKSFVDATDHYINAYNDFPVQAVHNLFKVLPALGVGKAMLITRAAVVDLLSIATNEALGNDDYEAWRSLNRQFILNPQSRPADQRTFGDLFDDSITGFDLFQLFKHALYIASDNGFFGRVGQIPIEGSRFPDSSLMDMTPVTSLVNEVFQSVSTLTSQDSWTDLVETAPRELADQVLLRTPPIGSWYDVRKGILNATFNKPSNRGRVIFVDANTGNQITDFEFFD